MSLTKIGSIGINTGIAFAGVTTIVTLNGSDAVLSVGGTVNFVSDVSIGGTVSIAGTLTYEDVTNVDAVGLITARDGIVVGSGITLSVDGDIFATGVVTATSFVGSGANLTGVASTENIRTNTNATFLQNVTVVGTSTVTGNIVPSSDSATDIGTNSVRFQNIYGDTLYGDGSNLTGIGGTDFIHAEQVNVSGIVTATAFIPTTGQLSHRNLLINGAMKINQRVSTSGLSYFNPVTTAIYTLDRWRVFIGASFDTNSAQISKSTQSPDEFSSSMKWDIGNTQTPSATQNCGIQQKIEGQDIQHLAYGTSSAKTMTLSFWVYSNKTGTYCVQPMQTDGTKYQLHEYTVSSADTWEKKTITIVGNTSDAINDDNTDGMNILWHLTCGSSDYESASATWTNSGGGGQFKATSNQVNLWDNASNYWYLTGCQLEVGSVATPFEHKKTGDELTLCQRYFQRLGYGRSSTYVAIGILVNSTQARCIINLGVSMRAQPTASEVGTLKADTEMSSSTNVTSVVSDYTTVNGGRVNFNIDSHSQGQGQVIQILTDTTTSGLDFDAEL